MLYGVKSFNSDVGSVYKHLVYKLEGNSRHSSKLRNNFGFLFNGLKIKLIFFHKNRNR